jgi:hypothetical protein
VGLAAMTAHRSPVAIIDEHSLPVTESGALTICIGATGIPPRNTGLIAIDMATERLASSVKGNFASN